MACAEQLSNSVNQRQLLLYGRLTALPQSSYVRRAALDADTIAPKQMNLWRKHGRPRLAWSTVVYAYALHICDNSEQLLHDLLPGVDGNFPAWRRRVEQCLQPSP